MPACRVNDTPGGENRPIQTVMVGVVLELGFIFYPMYMCVTACKKCVENKYLPKQENATQSGITQDQVSPRANSAQSCT